MPTYALPSALKFSNASFGLRKAGVDFRGAFNGKYQSVEFPAERWVMSVSTVPFMRENGGLAEAFLNLMAGGVNRVLLSHPTRFQPLGTMRGSPTVAVATARGDLAIQLTALAGSTLEPGDMIGVGGHLFQVSQSCAAIGTALTVPVVNRARGVISAGSAVTWNRPTVQFVCPSMMNSSVHQPGYLEGAAIDFEEAY